MRTLQQLTKRKQPPILATDVVQELRAVGAEIWHIEKQDSGLLIRSTINRKQILVLIPSATASTLPDERNNVVHVVTSIEQLYTWLQSLSAS
jgi:hypothetical protein